MSSLLTIYIPELPKELLSPSKKTVSEPEQIRIPESTDIPIKLFYTENATISEIYPVAVVSADLVKKGTHKLGKVDLFYCFYATGSQEDTKEKELLCLFGDPEYQFATGRSYLSSPVATLFSSLEDATFVETYLNAYIYDSIELKSPLRVSVTRVGSVAGKNMKGKLKVTENSDLYSTVAKYLSWAHKKAKILKQNLFYPEKVYQIDLKGHDSKDLIQTVLSLAKELLDQEDETGDILPKVRFNWRVCTLIFNEELCTSPLLSQILEAVNETKVDGKVHTTAGFPLINSDVHVIAVKTDDGLCVAKSSPKNISTFCLLPYSGE